MSVSIPCGICPSEIPLGAAACPACGRGVTDADRAVLQVRFEGGAFLSYDRSRRVRHGAKWIAALAILFAVSAPIVFMMERSDIDQSLFRVQFKTSRLRHAAEKRAEAMAQPPEMDGEEVTIKVDGMEYTEGELLSLRETVPRQSLVVNLILAGLMGGLWLWAHRAPLPAIACALGLFVLVQVVSGVLDPSSITKGIIIKLIAIGALAKGLRAALAARTALRQEAA